MLARIDMVPIIMWAAVGLFIALALAIIIAPAVHDFRRRRQFSKRTIMTEREWFTALGLATEDEMRLVDLMLGVASETIGVEPGRLRPDDRFDAQWGNWRILKLDDVQDALIEGIEEAILVDLHVERLSTIDLGTATLAEIIHDVLLSDIECAACSYIIKPRNLARCPECGTPLGWPAP